MSMDGDRSQEGISCNDGRTKQCFASTTNINKLVEKYKKTGQFPVNTRTPFYGDVSNLRSFQESLNVVTQARELFASLPAKIRERFNNDPASLVAFLDNPANLKEAVALGICVERKAGAGEPEVGAGAGTAPAGGAEPASGAGSVPAPK